MIKPTYLPVEDVAILNEVDLKLIMWIYYKNPANERFKIINNKIYALENYQYPYADEVDELRRKALIIAKTEAHLCTELAKLGEIKKTRLLQYFYRFTFKQIKQAKEVISLLEKYINQNSLIPIEELVYDY